MEKRPTKKQRELLNFIDGFIKGNGYGPSYREIMRALDYKSVSTVATHIDGLIARGWLAKKDNSARSLEVVSSDTLSSSVPNSRLNTQQEIENKIKELREAEIDFESIEILEKALEILGYEPTGKRTVV